MLVSRLRRLTLLAVAASAIAFVHGRMDTATSSSTGELSVPEPAHAKLMSLGFGPVLADYYWIQALQLVGGADRSTDLHGDKIADLIEVVTTLDPWVDHPYRFAAVWLTESVEDVLRANRLMRRSLSYHPDDWRNYFYLGYNHFFYLEDNRAAADVLEAAIDMPGAPGYLGAFVTRLRADGGSLEAAALFLAELIRNETDGYIRAGYLQSHDEIETERRARLLDRMRVVFWERHGRDIRTPEDLWAGSLRVMRQMPPAHPHIEGFGWELDEEGRIHSSFYGGRYELHIHPLDAERQHRWRSEIEAARGRPARAEGSV